MSQVVRGPLGRPLAGRLAAVLLGVAVAIVALGAMQPSTAARPGAVFEGVLVGEHSALQARMVDKFNAAISASTQAPRGEHAGISSAEYHALGSLAFG